MDSSKQWKASFKAVDSLIKKNKQDGFGYFLRGETEEDDLLFDRAEADIRMGQRLKFDSSKCRVILYTISVMRDNHKP